MLKLSIVCSQIILLLRPIHWGNPKNENLFISRDVCPEDIKLKKKENYKQTNKQRTK